MKKYKLIKEYPGSPKLGVEFILGNEWSCCGSFYKPYYDISKYPEFWEEVVEKDYEIISFYFNGKLFSKNHPKSSELFIYWSKEDTWVNFTSKNCTIHSVKRIIDGEVFTVGDKAKTKSKTNIHRITSFKIQQRHLDRFTFESKYNIWVNWEKGEGGNWLENIKHHKILFTTEDGVDIFEGDEVTPVNLVTLRMHASFTIKTGQSLSYGSYKHFSTQKAAEEYILMNKPCLSLKDFENLWLNSCWSDAILEKVKELVKTKL